MKRLWQKFVHFFTKRKGTFLKLGVSLISLLLLFYAVNPLPWLIEWMLVCETPFQPADIVRIDGIGGQLNQAVEFYHKGLVKGILVNASVPDRYKEVNEPICNYHFIMEDLHESGIPDEAIFEYSCDAKTRAGQQRCFREWMYNNDFTSYIIQPSRLHTCFEMQRHRDTFPNGDVTLVMVPSRTKLVLRKQIVNIHNTIIRMLYWHFVSRPELLQKKPALLQTASALVPLWRTPFYTQYQTHSWDSQFHS